MGAAATLIGLLPGYAQIGVWAPILLVVLRMLQGFSAGGEIGGAASYIREWAPPKRRALYISFLPSIAQFGKGLAAAIAGLAAATLTDPEMLSWGWRIPFLLALPLGIIGLYMRLSIEDSPEFASKKNDAKVKKGQPFAELIRDYRKPLAKVIMIAMVQNIGTYIGTVFIAAYFSSILGYSKGEASTIVLIAVILAAFLIPLAGQLGSYRGGKTILRYAYVAYAVVSIPSFMLMQQSSVNLAMVGLALGMIPYALCQAGTYSVMPEFFPMHIRHTGVAFGHSVGAVIGGGSGPFLATWLIGATGNQSTPAIVARHGAGYDNVDYKAAEELGVWVTNTPGENRRSVVEHVFALLLGLSRKIQLATDQTRNEIWAADRLSLTGIELEGRTLGLIGFGDIGRHVAPVAEAFGMKVLATDPAYDASFDKRLVDLDTLLAQADVVSLHVPLQAGTENLIGGTEIEKMKTGAILINTSRGGVIDEAAVAEALRSGKLGGAGVDVLAAENTDMITPFSCNTFPVSDLPNLL
eukprot:gene4157-4071_t